MCIQISINNGRVKKFSNKLEAISYLSKNDIKSTFKQKNKLKDYSFENCTKAVQEVEDYLVGKIDLPSIDDITKIDEILSNKTC